MKTAQVQENLEFREFPGQNIYQMPEIRKAGLVPANAMQVMRGIIAGKLYGKQYDSVDGIAYHPDGQVKIVLDAQELLELTTQSTLLYGSLVLLDGAWESLEGEVFTRSHVIEYGDKWLTNDPAEEASPRYAKSNPFWREFARSQELHEKYVDFVSKKLGRTDDMMKVLFARRPDTPTMHLWCLDGFGYSSCSAYGNYSLRNDDSRLVGIAETRNDPSLENKLSK